MKIAVIGGSLSGLSCAALLQRAGFEVEVHEAAPITVNRAGGVLGLEHHTLEVLDNLGIHPWEIVPADVEQVVRIHVRDRTEHDCVQTVYPGRNTTWTLLHSALARRIDPSSVQHNSKIKSDGGTFVGKTGEIRADLVIFADGRTSVGRATLDPARQLQYAGYVAHRGESGERSDPMTAVRFTVSDRSMLAAFPVGNGGVDWTMYTNCTRQQYEKLFGASPEKRPFALPHHVSDDARDAVNTEASRCLPSTEMDLVQGTTQRAAAAVMDVPPPTQMVWALDKRRRAVLIGDALAPVRPHTARGVNNGIDQGATLVGVLRQVMRYGADLDAALEAWQQRCLPQVIKDVERGPEMGAKLGLGDGAQ